MRDLYRLTPAERFLYLTGLWLNDNDDQEEVHADVPQSVQRDRRSGSRGRVSRLPLRRSGRER